MTEDSVTGYSQTNYYANTPNQPFYGWESKDGHTTDCYFNDLARGIYSNYYGDPCSPATISAETVYDYSYTLPLPPTVIDKRQVNVVGLLIDHKTGYIVNAFSAKPEAPVATAIDNPIFDGNYVYHVPQGNAVTEQRFSLTGQRVNRTYRGIIVRNGRKILSK